MLSPLECQLHDLPERVGIPDNCHFFYTGEIFGAKNLHPSARKSGQIGFRDKIA